MHARARNHSLHSRLDAHTWAAHTWLANASEYVYRDTYRRVA